MSLEPGAKCSLYVTCLFDEIKLHVDDTAYDLTIWQAEELRDILDGAIEHDSKYSQKEGRDDR